MFNIRRDNSIIIYNVYFKYLSIRYLTTIYLTMLFVAQTTQHRIIMN